MGIANAVLDRCSLRRFEKGGRMKIALWAGFVFLTSGCAFSNVHVELPNAIPTHLSGGYQRQVVVVKPFADERATRNRCGMQKNGYNMDTADALCTPEPAVWIADLLATQLRAAGFAVVAPESGVKPGALVVNGALLKLFVEPVLGFTSVTLETDVQVRLTVTLRQRLAR